MTEILATEILAVSGDLGGNTEVTFRDECGEFRSLTFSPGKTFDIAPPPPPKPPKDVADAVEQLIRACTTPDDSATANIPVEAARRRLYDTLDRYGIDGTGWMPDPLSREELRVVEEERDRQIARVEELEVALAWERERAEKAEAAVREWELETDARWRYIGGMEPA